jgi:CubicO group peptidase (beta-lactamase class C family)
MFALDSGSLLLEAPFKDYLPELNDREIGKLRFRDLLRSGTNKEQKGKPIEEEILRRILSRATGIPMERYLAERLFIPLGMKNTGHTQPRASRRGAELSPESRIAGLFSSAQDLGIFAQMLLNRGIYNHRRYFKLETVDTFTGSESLWAQPSESDWTSKVFSPQAFGHLSDSGSLLWVDPSSRLFIVLLANGRPENGVISEAQRKICESVISALQD